MQEKGRAAKEMGKCTPKKIGRGGMHPKMREMSPKLHGEEPEERGMSSKKGGMCPKLERGDPKKGEFTPKRANISQIGGGGGETKLEPN